MLITLQTEKVNPLTVCHSLKQREPEEEKIT